MLSVVLPVPMVIYLGFIFAQQQWRTFKENEREQNKIYPFLSFLLSIISTIGVIFLFERLFHGNFEKSKYPFVINSSIISLYILNYSQLKNIYLAGILSGISIGTVLPVVFF